MNYNVKFPNSSCEKKFDKVFAKIDARTRETILDILELLGEKPLPHGVRKITPPISLGQDTAKYRIRIGNYRLLYDVDAETKTVWILMLRRRSEKTYKGR